MPWGSSPGSHCRLDFRFVDEIGGPDRRRTATRTTAVAVAFESALGVFALAIAWLFGRDLFVLLDWKPVAVLWGVVASLPWAVAAIAVHRWPVGPLRHLTRLVDQLVVPLFKGCTIAETMAVSMAAGLGEELLFRGLLQGALAERWGTPAALLIASLAFGLAHPMSGSYVALATLLGLYFGALWYWTGNLLVPIAAHAMYDAVVLSYLVRGPLRRPG